MAQQLDSYRIDQLLRHRHMPPEWAYFGELRSGTGAYSTQSIDGVAINLWPSKKFRTVAYEIKVSRGDFMREIQNPKKRAFAETISNECYFAVPHKLVDPEEVPEGWGLIFVNAGGLRTAKVATQRDSVSWPQSFVASIARRCSDDAPSVPKPLWNVLGKEIDADELLKLASDLRGETVEKQIENVKWQLRHEVKNEPRAKFLREIDALIGLHLGSGYTMDDLRSYLAGNGSSRMTDSRLKQMHEWLGEMLEREQQS